jgi:CubicO group peptidase (beta-lactamase class C family)
MRRLRTFARPALLLVGLPLVLPAQAAPFQGLDAYVVKAMQDWKVPGLALAIVHNDSVVVLKGYGVRTLGKSEPVNEHTLFAIGSSSKAFTATLAAMMVDEGKMQWDAPVSRYLSGFQLYDSYASREITLRDILSHRSGLARGDLMWYGSDLSRDEIVRRVRFLKPSWSFRSQFGYQNIMFLTAGQSIAQVAGRPWEELVRDRIFQPLGMQESNTSTRTLAGLPNVATPHAELNDTVRTVAWRNIDNIAPAGAINSTASDMSRWVRFHLNGGKVDGKQLLSKGALDQEYVPNVVVPVAGPQRALNPETHFMEYGLGWFLQDYRGREIVQHGGNIDGMTALVAFMPEEKTGLVILTNMNGATLPTALMYRVFDVYLKATPRDWSAELLKAVSAQLAQAKEAQKKQEATRVAGTKPSLSLDDYAGIYSDSMYGDAKVRMENGALHASLGAAFDGTLEHWHYDTFRATWRDPMLGKSLMTFVLGTDGKIAQLKIEGLADFARRPTPVDTTAKVALAASDLQKFTGTYTNAQTHFSADVQLVGGALRLTIPGQPAYTLVADAPTRFRLTGPPGMPAGFFLEFAVAGERVTSATLIQPAPRPTMVLDRK